MEQQKPKVVKDFEKLDEQIRQQIKLAYPYGFHNFLIFYTDREGKKVSALPFETDEKYYLVRMTADEARQIIRDDEDFDSTGNLKTDVREDYEDKFSDIEYMADYLEDETEESEEEEY
jgi:hypothetical protein